MAKDKYTIFVEKGYLEVDKPFWETETHTVRIPKEEAFKIFKTTNVEEIETVFKQHKIYWEDIEKYLTHICSNFSIDYGLMPNTNEEYICHIWRNKGKKTIRLLSIEEIDNEIEILITISRYLIIETKYKVKEI